MTLDEAREHLGEQVVYRPSFAAVRNGVAAEDERGVITSVNSRYVFVRYFGQRDSKATPAGRLTLTEHKPQEG